MCETKKLEVKRLSDLTDIFSGTDTARRMKEVVPLVKLLLVLPSSSSCNAERSFSALRRLKTYIRSTMSVSRLNHVTVLHIHKTLTDELRCERVCVCQCQWKDRAYVRLNMNCDYLLHF